MQMSAKFTVNAKAIKEVAGKLSVCNNLSRNFLVASAVRADGVPAINELGGLGGAHAAGGAAEPLSALEFLLPNLPTKLFFIRTFPATNKKSTAFRSIIACSCHNLCLGSLVSVMRR
jgi:hypothetical protein